MERPSLPGEIVRRSSGWVVVVVPLLFLLFDVVFLLLLLSGFFVVLLLLPLALSCAVVLGIILRCLWLCVTDENFLAYLPLT